MSTHTPGGWTAEINGSRRKFWTVWNNQINARICVVQNDSSDEANAKLIAASPDLLKALQSIMLDIDAGRMLTANRTASARAAIAKATL